MPQVCGPANITGPLQHTLFLGCSVTGFTTELGWNEQVTSATVYLVEDPCPAPESGPKHYWDKNLEPQTTTDPDPGFFGEYANIEGCPVFFKMGTFELGAIVQSWEKSYSSGGNPTYSVKLSVPSEILQGVQLIIGDFSGDVKREDIPFYNIFNVFGFAETTGYDCPTYSLLDGAYEYTSGDSGPDGATFGSLASVVGQGKFAGSRKNANGMQWSIIKKAFQILTGSVNPIFSQFSAYGRVYYNGVVWNTAHEKVQTGCGLVFVGDDTTVLGKTPYIVDISLVPDPPAYYRISGTSISLQELISKICGDTGYDYYTELSYVKANDNILNIIKIRPVSRVNQRSSLDKIETFINTARSSNIFISGSHGKELRNELMSSFLLGANKQTIYQAYQPPVAQRPEDMSEHTIIPYFGTDLNGNYIQVSQQRETPFSNEDLQEAPYEWTIQPDPTSINNSLTHLHFTEAPVIGITEILTARVGFDSWRSLITIDPDWYTDTGYLVKTAEDYSQEFGAEAFLSAGKVLDSIIRDENPAARDAFFVNSAVLGDLKNQTDNEINEDIRKVYEWVASFADFVGKEFLVSVPFTCVKVDEESGAVEYSENPTNDGGWTQQSTVLQLANPGYALDFFSSENGKILTFARLEAYAENVDLSYVGVDNYIVVGDGQNTYVYVKAQVEEQFLYSDITSQSNPRIHISLSDSYTLKTLEQLGMKGQYDAISGIDRMLQRVDSAHDTVIQDMHTRIGARAMNEPGFKYPAVIDGVAIPMRSNVLTYGPWYVSGPPGQLRVEKDDGLAPWEFGAGDNIRTPVQLMNYVGLELAKAGVTKQQVGEVGEVTIAGYPEASLGAELLTTSTGSSYAGEKPFELRVAAIDQVQMYSLNDGFATNYQIYTLYCQVWSGEHGPNVTGISVQVGESGITTSYQLRTFTAYPGRFAKLNAERLKQIGQQKIKQERRLRFLQEFNNFTNNKSSGAKGSNLAQREKQASRAITANTPHEVFVGQIYDFRDNVKRTLVASESMGDLVNEINSGFPEKAIVSLESILRPVSMDGDGGLPRYIVPLGKINQSSSKGSIGPIQSGTNSTVYYGGEFNDDSIDQDDLNPFSNPTGFSRCDVTEYKLSSGNTGHDIDIVARSGEGRFENPYNITMFTGSGGRDYRDDYRFMALKGPIVLQQWGYDLDGKPVPNEIDTLEAASGGIFESTGLKNAFMANWLQEPHAWPVAPLDVRLDRERGLWVAPPPKDHLVIELQDSISANGSGYASVVLEDYEEYYNHNGQPITEPGVIVYDVLGNTYTPTTKLIAKYHERHERWEIQGGGGGGGDLQIVLIDTDISGIKEHTPINYLIDSEVEKPSGYAVVFQDPPSDNYNENEVEELDLLQYKRVKIPLKVFKTEPVTGVVISATPSGITLDSSAVAEADAYNGDTITITSGHGAGQSKPFADYSASRVGSFSSVWDIEPEPGDLYSISSESNLVLDHEVINDSANNRVIVRYKTINVWYDDGEAFLVGKYKRADFPDYPEHEQFPGDIPEEKLSRRFRGIVINGVLVTALCKPLPPPDLTGYYL